MAERDRDPEVLMEVPTLDWPADPFFRRRNITVQGMQHQKLPDPSTYCACGKEHRRFYPRTQRSTYGRGFNVTYFCSNACKGSVVKKDGQVPRQCGQHSRRTTV
jgi:hypothetical protein